MGCGQGLLLQAWLGLIQGRPRRQPTCRPSPGHSLMKLPTRGPCARAKWKSQHTFPQTNPVSQEPVIFPWPTLRPPAASAPVNSAAFPPQVPMSLSLNVSSAPEVCSAHCQGRSKCYLKTGFASWWVSSQRTQPSQRAAEERIYHLQQVRKTPRIFLKAVSPRVAKLGTF